MSSEIELLQRKLDRERDARLEAEKLLEAKSLEMYQLNLKLKKANEDQELVIMERTQKLAASESLYQSLVESINDLICKTDAGGTITFVNRITAQTLGYKVDEVVGQHVSGFIGPAYRKKVFKSILKQFALKNRINYLELPIISKNGTEKWLGCNIQFIDTQCLGCEKKHSYFMGDIPVVVGENCHYEGAVIVSRDISKQKEALMINERQSKQLEKLLRQQVIISEIALELNTLTCISQRMNNVVRMIGEHLGVSRVYIFENSPDISETTNTYEWCNTGISPQIDDLKNIPYTLIPSWKELLTTDGIVYSENIFELPDDLVSVLEPQQIKSIIVLPLTVTNSFFGFIGFDECTRNHQWEASEIELLRTLSNIISNAYERVAIEENLRKREEENRTIIDSIPDYIFIHGASDRIWAYRRSRNEAYPFTTQEIENKEIDEILPPEFAVGLRSALNEARANGHFQFGYQHNQRGQVRDFEARLVKMESGEIMSIVRDVTEIKENEKQLKIARDKAENASRSKSEFLANVSHEIRTPMNAILGFSEILIDKISDPTYQSHLKTILNSGRTLLSLINDILDMSKIEAGRLDLEYEPMQFRTVIYEIDQIFKPKTEKKKLSFETIIHSNVPDHIFMDEVRFHQILFNIVGNAVKFTDKGFVRLESWVEEANGQRDLVIEIEDSGIGIPQQQQEAIFDAFTQQSGQSNRQFEGTGLGLAITRRLVEKMNGAINLESKVGKGSTFTIRLSDIKTAEIADPSEGALVPEDTKIRFKSAAIMIVDDIDYNIQVIKNMLEGYGFNFIEAYSGEKALEMLEFETPNIIFMDIRMAGMSGIAATEVIKNNARLKNIPVVAFTASAMKNQIEEIKTLFDGYIRKPISKKVLLQTLKHHLPYQTADELPPDESPALSLPPGEECTERLPQLIEALEKEAMQTWHDVSDSLVIFEIDEFCNKLETINQPFNCDIIKFYITSLREALQSFDVDSIEKNLKGFGDVYSRLKNIEHH